MAVSEKGGAEYRRNEDKVTQIQEEAFILLEMDAEDNFAGGKIQRMEQNTCWGVTLAAVLSLLQPHENVFIMYRISLHELKAVGGGTVEELQVIRCVEMCGGYEAKWLELTVDDLMEDWTKLDKPVFSDYYRRKVCK